jgi:hypothetical protein
MNVYFMTLVEKINKKWLYFFLMGTVVFATLVITRVFGAIELLPEAAVDSQMSYTSDVFYKYLEIQGSAGRAGYLRLHLIDYLFITQFYTALTISITLLLKKINVKKQIYYIALVPLVGGILDIFENVVVDSSILIYPNKMLFLGNILPYFTFLKFVIIYISFVLISLLVLFMTGKAIAKKLNA